MLPSLLPDWLPSWIQLAVVLLAVLFGFVLLLMPFAVFGLKGRLQTIEERLEDLGADVRMLAGRLADANRAASGAPVRASVEEEVPIPPRPASPSRPRGPAPLPPRPVEPGFDRHEGPEPVAAPRNPSRDHDAWFDPDEERRPSARPLRATTDRSSLDRVPTARIPDDRAPNDRAPNDRAPGDRAVPDRERDPDRLRYSGRPRNGAGTGEREEPSLRWPPR